MERKNKLHIRDLIDGLCGNMADRDGVCFFIADEISDTGFIMKTVLNLMNKGCKTFYFFGKHKGIWYKTVRDLADQSGSECEELKIFDSMDDMAEKAAGFLNGGMDVYLFGDSRKNCSIAAEKIRQREVHISFHIGSLLNSME